MHPILVLNADLKARGLLFRHDFQPQHDRFLLEFEWNRDSYKIVKPVIPPEFFEEKLHAIVCSSAFELNGFRDQDEFMSFTTYNRIVRGLNEFSRGVGFDACLVAADWHEERGSSKCEPLREWGETLAKCWADPPFERLTATPHRYIEREHPSIRLLWSKNGLKVWDIHAGEMREFNLETRWVASNNVTRPASGRTPAARKLT